MIITRDSLADAIEKNGLTHIRDNYFRSGGACALGQAGYNLLGAKSATWGSFNTMLIELSYIYTGMSACPIGSCRSNTNKLRNLIVHLNDAHGLDLASIASYVRKVPNFEITV